MQIGLDEGVHYKKCRLKIGKKPEATFAIIDSQSVKTTDRAEKRGIDGGKKNQGA